jgi:mannose-1-phosphate guanylyltransferase
MSFVSTTDADDRRLWAVVLAGGEGRRVSALTLDATGEPVPKQYCTFGTDEPLVARAVRRAAGVVPRERILVVVAREHLRHWREALSGLPQENIIVQPRNRGTAPGLLLPVLDVLLRRDRDARLLVLPADHHVASEHVLKRALQAAAAAVRRADAPVVLLGMVGEGGDHEYGWIVPAAGPAGSLRSVLSFVEKPDRARSRELQSMGALVNSFILAFRARTLVQLYEDVVPELLRALVPVVLAGRPEAALREQYDAIASHDFSRAVLERFPDALGVLPVPPCGWSDLGTPARIERFLGASAAWRDTGRRGAWMPTNL